MDADKLAALRLKVLEECGNMIVEVGKPPKWWTIPALKLLRRLEAIIRAETTIAVTSLRRTGHTEAEIAAALGCSVERLADRWPDFTRRAHHNVDYN
jgi:hypothetical protein